ncbi:hypothetical protein TNCV_2372121 [Trichonephila clavipes]|nr:hypothetical protein TNCV_2372121 [Trichonephila clavipes]
MLWGGKLLVETILRQTRTPSSVHSEEWDKLPQQLLDNVVQKMITVPKLNLEINRSKKEKNENHPTSCGFMQTLLKDLAKGKYWRRFRRVAENDRYP